MHLDLFSCLQVLATFSLSQYSSCREVVEWQVQEWNYLAEDLLSFRQVNHLELKEVVPWSILELGLEIDRVGHLSVVPFKFATADLAVFDEDPVADLAVLDSHAVLFG